MADKAFQPLIAQFEEQMLVLTDPGFHTKAGEAGDVPNMKVCPKNTWNDHMFVEMVLSMPTGVY